MQPPRSPNAHLGRNLQRAQFLQSASDLRSAPADRGHEVAFIGRSNAGKSSALNVITGRAGLARVSKTPGRTRQLVFFTLDVERRLVDLPGYGYARVAADARRTWQHGIEQYLVRRRALRGLVLVMDVRHPLTGGDHILLSWCAKSRLPVHVLLTKADKLSRGAAKLSLLEARRALSEGPWHTSVQLFSARQRVGVEEAQGVVGRWLQII